MNRVPARTLIAAAALGLVALVVAACGAGEKAPAGAKSISVALTENGCEPKTVSAPAGPIEFQVTNEGSSRFTEFEVLDGETILGERENITEGLSRSFALTLEEGEYTLRCDESGAEGEGTLKVSGKLETKKSPQIAKAIADYRRYLLASTEGLTAGVRPFAAAIVAGDVARAKRLYPAARLDYERIEPVAESFGDLDPRIDARENDVPAGEFGGFHRLEKALWEEGTTDGMKPVAAALVADVVELEREVGGVSLQAVQIANGANELLSEVSTSKITGEEERYSHLDLVDFKANVEGAEVAFAAVAPLLAQQRPEPVQAIERDFAAVYKALRPYQTAGWPGFVLYTELDKADTRKLAQVIDALAEKLSLVPAQIAQGEQA